MRDTNVGGTAGSVVYFQLRPAPTVISFSFVRRTWSSIPAIFYPSAVPSWGAAGLPAAIWTRRPVSGHVYCCNSVNPTRAQGADGNNRSIRLLADLPPKWGFGTMANLQHTFNSCLLECAHVIHAYLMPLDTRFLMQLFYLKHLLCF